MLKYILLLTMSTNVLAMSSGQAANIYKRIAGANGINMAPRLIISNSGDINASSGGFRITLNRGMLNYVRNSNEIALVLGHELAHYTLGHNNSNPSNEYAADRVGAQYAQRAGYNKCNGALIFVRLNAPNSSSHPASMSRYKALGC